MYVGIKEPVRLIIDINNLCFRNATVNAALCNSKGEPTGGIYGSLKSIVGLCGLFEPRELICVRDSFCEFRKEIYPKYKANRSDSDRTPREVLARRSVLDQLQSLEEMLGYLGIPVLSAKGLEADDLASFVSNGIRFAGLTILVSGDKDYLQLVKPGTGLYNPSSGKPKLVLHNGLEMTTNHLSEADAKAAFLRVKMVGPLTYTRFTEKLPRGIALDRWLLYRVLVGDSSDNLSGVVGFGPVTAQKITDRFYSLEDLKEAGEEIYSIFLSKKESAALTAAFESGDLEKQYKIIDLSLLLREEGAADVIEGLQAEIRNVSTNEHGFRREVVRWGMSTFLIGFDKFLTIFPAFQNAAH